MKIGAIKAEFGSVAAAARAQIKTPSISIGADFHSGRTDQPRQEGRGDAHGVALEQRAAVGRRIEHYSVHPDAEGKTHPLIAAREPQAHRREHVGERIGVWKISDQNREEDQHTNRGVAEPGGMPAEETRGPSGIAKISRRWARLARAHVAFGQRDDGHLDIVGVRILNAAGHVHVRDRDRRRQRFDPIERIDDLTEADVLQLRDRRCTG